MVRQHSKVFLWPTRTGLAMDGVIVVLLLILSLAKLAICSDDSVSPQRGAALQPWDDAVGTSRHRRGSVLTDRPHQSLVTGTTNYASVFLGARVVEHPASAEGSHAILNDDLEKYMIVPCSEEKKKITIQLSREIIPRVLVLQNAEYSSSMVKEFVVLGSKRLPCQPPACMWNVLGRFEANFSRLPQTFSLNSSSRHHIGSQDSGSDEATTLPDAVIVARFLRILWVSHHGTERLCTLTGLQVYGLDAQEWELLVLDHQRALAASADGMDDLARFDASMDHDAPQDDDDADDVEPSLSKKKFDNVQDDHGHGGIQAAGPPLHYLHFPPHRPYDAVRGDGIADEGSPLLPRSNGEPHGRGGPPRPLELPSAPHNAAGDGTLKDDAEVGLAPTWAEEAPSNVTATIDVLLAPDSGVLDDDSVMDDDDDDHEIEDNVAGSPSHAEATLLVTALSPGRPGTAHPSGSIHQPRVTAESSSSSGMPPGATRNLVHILVDSTQAAGHRPAPVCHVGSRHQQFCDLVNWTETSSRQREHHAAADSDVGPAGPTGGHGKAAPREMTSVGPRRLPSLTGGAKALLQLRSENDGRSCANASDCLPCASEILSSRVPVNASSLTIAGWQEEHATQQCASLRRAASLSCDCRFAALRSAADSAPRMVLIPAPVDPARPLHMRPLRRRVSRGRSKPKRKQPSIRISKTRKGRGKKEAKKPLLHPHATLGRGTAAFPALSYAVSAFTQATPPPQEGGHLAASSASSGFSHASHHHHLGALVFMQECHSWQQQAEQITRRMQADIQGLRRQLNKTQRAAQRSMQRAAIKHDAAVSLAHVALRREMQDQQAWFARQQADDRRATMAREARLLVEIGSLQSSTHTATVVSIVAVIMAVLVAVISALSAMPAARTTTAARLKGTTSPSTSSSPPSVGEVPPDRPVSEVFAAPSRKGAVGGGGGSAPGLFRNGRRRSAVLVPPPPPAAGTEATTDLPSGSSSTSTPRSLWASLFGASVALVFDSPQEDDHDAATMEDADGREGGGRGVATAARTSTGGGGADSGAGSKLARKKSLSAFLWPSTPKSS